MIFTQAARPLGILVMDARIARPLGDVGNPRTFPFPVLLKRVAGASLSRLIEQRDPALVEPFVAAGRELADEGAFAVTSTCGFLILFQKEIAAALPLPVFTSSLLQIPLINRLLKPGERLGVITADSRNLTGLHFGLAGAEPGQVIPVVGLEAQPHFRRAVLSGEGVLDLAGVEDEVRAKARELVSAPEGDRIKAILLECANLPPYAAAVQAETGRPVFDFLTLIDLVQRAWHRG